MQMVKILISLPVSAKAFLDQLKEEGYTASGYVAHLLAEDLKRRRRAGWTPTPGWKNAPAKRKKEN